MSTDLDTMALFALLLVFLAVMLIASQRMDLNASSLNIAAPEDGFSCV